MMESSEQQPLKRKRGCRGIAAICLVILVIAVVYLWHGVQNAREAARYCWCNNQFKQIGLAMHTYHQAYGCFPPAYVADATGRPMHSWRVLLLPFMEQDERYQRYKLKESWNSLNNAKIVDWPVNPEEPGNPPMYLCPSDYDAGRCDTSRFVFVGPNTVFPGSQTANLGNLPDGSSNTALGSEMSESGVHWMEPKDFNVEEMSFKINDKDRISVRSNHPHIVNISFADGSVRSVKDDIDPKLLKALITIDGGEDVSALNDW